MAAMLLTLIPRLLSFNHAACVFIAWFLVDGK